MTLERHPRIMVTGVSGVGKTHLLEPLRDDPKLSVNVIGFGNSMSDVLRKATGAADTPLSSLPLETRQIVQRRVAREIEALADEQPIIIDGHLLVEQAATGFRVPGIPGEHYQSLDLDGIIQIVDDPQRILDRRMRDQRRYGDRINDLDFVKEFQSDIRLACITYSILFGCFFVVFDLRKFENINDDPNWQVPRDKIAEQIIGIVQSIKNEKTYS
ncbi:adenylate kinase [Breoghania corrubedonensis]|uniref:Adenylate kinase n=1 Tax=Breoghania corrubedonensis TaxID=665038 RepID=A0A2T5UQT9_9HYPH|nr:AAA family ATPase [Breoghania corrubedonensis]PTW53888.1 adenylate kinase [Breoghania corrubedonensis]